MLKQLQFISNFWCIPWSIEIPMIFPMKSPYHPYLLRWEKQKTKRTFLLRACEASHWGHPKAWMTNGWLVDDLHSWMVFVRENPTVRNGWLGVAQWQLTETSKRRRWRSSDKKRAVSFRYSKFHLANIRTMMVRNCAKCYRCDMLW